MRFPIAAVMGLNSVQSGTQHRHIPRDGRDGGEAREKSVGKGQIAAGEAEGVKAAAREVERVVCSPESLKRLLDQQAFA